MPKMIMKGLKCDNPDCDWVDMSIKREDYPKFVGMKCPKCGSIVLTEKDFTTIKVMEGLIKVINHFYMPFEKKSKKWSYMNAKMDGSGKVNFTEPTEIDNPYYEGE